MELAQRLGTSQSSITSWEQSRREPDFKTIKKLCEFFGVPMSALLPNDDDTNDDFIGAVAELFNQNPKFRTLFEKVRFMSNSNLDALIAVATAMQKEN